MNKETLEEFIERSLRGDTDLCFHDGVKLVAKWYEANSYNVEDMKHAYIEGRILCGGILEDTTGEIEKEADLWIEEFNRHKF
jgi:hypothetical protein